MLADDVLDAGLLADVLDVLAADPHRPPPPGTRPSEATRAGPPFPECAHARSLGRPRQPRPTGRPDSPAARSNRQGRRRRAKTAAGSATAVAPDQPVVPGDGAAVGQRGDLVDHRADPPGVVRGVLPGRGEPRVQRLGRARGQVLDQFGQHLPLPLVERLPVGVVIT